MSEIRKIALNVMNLGGFLDDAPIKDHGRILENLSYAAATSSKEKAVDIKYTAKGKTYKFIQEDKTIRRDLLELTYRYVK